MDEFSVSLIGLWIGAVAVLLASGPSGVGGVGVWDDDVKSLEFLDAGLFKSFVHPLVEMAANAYRYPGVIPISGWILVDAVAPIHGGVHALVYKDDLNAGRMVLAFRGTAIDGSEAGRADVCADEILWGDTPAYFQPENCSQFGSDTLDYYKQAVDYTKETLEAHPQASFLLTGHSLGASLAILVAATFGSNLLLPVVAFSSGGTKSILDRMSLELTSDHGKLLYIVADKWDQIMRSSWENQIGNLCLYETNMTEDCAACFQDQTIASITKPCEEFSNFGDSSPNTPSRIEDSILKVGEVTEKHPNVEMSQTMLASAGSSADCLNCFYETHYMRHVINLVELGKKPVCESTNLCANPRGS